MESSSILGEKRKRDIFSDEIVLSENNLGIRSDPSNSLLVKIAIFVVDIIGMLEDSEDLHYSIFSNKRTQLAYSQSHLIDGRIKILSKMTFGYLIEVLSKLSLNLVYVEGEENSFINVDLNDLIDPYISEDIEKRIYITCINLPKRELYDFYHVSPYSLLKNKDTLLLNTIGFIAIWKALVNGYCFDSRCFDGLLAEKVSKELGVPHQVISEIYCALKVAKQYGFDFRRNSKRTTLRSLREFIKEKSYCISRVNCDRHSQ